MILDDSSYKMLYHVLVYYEKKYKKKMESPGGAK